MISQHAEYPYMDSNDAVDLMNKRLGTVLACR